MRRAPAALILLLALATAAHGDPQTDRAVRALRENPSLKVRAQAALVLGQAHALEAVPALAAALAGDEAPAVRIAAASALGKVGEAEGRRALEAAQKGDPDPSVRAAAGTALAELAPAERAPSPAAAHGVAVSLEEPGGAAGNAADRLALRDALGRRLREAGFQVVSEGGLRLKPSLVKLDVDRGGQKTVIAVRAELVAVERGGRMAAMLEGAARLSAAGALGERDLASVSVRAFDVVAKTLSDDLATRLGER
jgi:HEAT repeat protein